MWLVSLYYLLGTAMLPQAVAQADVPGGILVWAPGRVASETFFANVYDVSLGQMVSVNGRESEMYKHTDGIPTSGLNESMAAGKRFVHIKPGHLTVGYGKPGRMQSREELFERAKAAGYTLVMVLHRSNEFAQLNSAAMYDNGTGMSEEAKIAEVTSRYCHQPDVVERMTSVRKSLRDGLVVARETGLWTAVTTTEAVVRDMCEVARATLTLYNNVSAFKIPVAPEACKRTVKISSQQAHRPLEERIGPNATACVRKTFAGAPEYNWMLEEDGYRLEPPETWRRIWDGLPYGRTQPSDTAPTVFGIPAAVPGAILPVAL